MKCLRYFSGNLMCPDTKNYMPFLCKLSTYSICFYTVFATCIYKQNFVISRKFMV